MEHEGEQDKMSGKRLNMEERKHRMMGSQDRDRAKMGEKKRVVN